MLRKAGYYTAYKGKWHLSREFDTKSIEQFMTPNMEKYGFADNFSPGDLIGHTLGGYSYDHITAGSAINWLRTKGRPLADDGKPWCMFVSFVNPHDIMYFNTDAPGRARPGHRQAPAARRPRARARALQGELGRAGPGQPAPAVRCAGPAEGARRVRPHLGLHPRQRAARGRALEALQRLLRQLHPQRRPLARGAAGRAAMRCGSTENTIVVFTSDHGEMAGAHGLRGKGPFAYRETTHLPLYVVHPDVAGGQQCQALSSHIDLVPTLLSMAGVKPDRAGELAGRALPGKDLVAAARQSRPPAGRCRAAGDAVHLLGPRQQRLRASSTSPPRR